MKNKNTILVFLALFTLVLLSRLTAHTWGFTLVGGAFLFAGAYFQDKKIAMALMLSSMLVTDAIIGFHSELIVVYFCYALFVGLGYLLTVNSDRFKIIAGSLVASVLFYLITNFAVWYGSGIYPATAAGLIESYVMAIPFFRNQLISDILFSFAFFEVAKALVKHRVLVLEKSRI
ncbi:hypothetical protein K2P97_09665 [bacterium]|nr:hypothetical protein [bacterium]